MDSSTLLAALGVLITVLLAVAGTIGAWAALRVGRNSTVLSNYKTAAESAQTVATSLQAEVQQLRAELAETRATAQRERAEWAKSQAALESRITVLQELATGHSGLEALARQMEAGLVAQVAELRKDMQAEFDRTRAVIGAAA